MAAAPTHNWLRSPASCSALWEGPSVPLAGRQKVTLFFGVTALTCRTLFGLHRARCFHFRAQRSTSPWSRREFWRTHIDLKRLVLHTDSTHTYIIHNQHMYHLFLAVQCHAAVEAAHVSSVCKDASDSILQQLVSVEVHCRSQSLLLPVLLRHPQSPCLQHLQRARDNRGFSSISSIDSYEKSICIWIAIQSSSNSQMSKK